MIRICRNCGSIFTHKKGIQKLGVTLSYCSERLWPAILKANEMHGMECKKCLVRTRQIVVPEGYLLIMDSDELVGKYKWPERVMAEKYKLASE